MFPALQNLQCVSPIKPVSETTQICKTCQGWCVCGLQQLLHGKYSPVFVKGRSSCVDLHTELRSLLINTQPIKEARQLCQSPPQEPAQSDTKGISAGMLIEAVLPISHSWGLRELTMEWLPDQNLGHPCIMNVCFTKSACWLINNTDCLQSR